METVRPISLRKQANAMAKNYGAKGAFIIVCDDEGVRIGTDGLTFDQQREALCVAINYTFAFEEQLKPKECPQFVYTLRTFKDE